MYNLTFNYVHLVPEDNHLHLNTFLSLLFLMTFIQVLFIRMIFTLTTVIFQHDVFTYKIWGKQMSW